MNGASIAVGLHAAARERVLGRRLDLIRLRNKAREYEWRWNEHATEAPEDGRRSA